LKDGLVPPFFSSPPTRILKVKLKLETMSSGDSLEVLLDLGEPEKNVPRSIKNDGHEVPSMEKINGHFKIVVKKA
jgi:TusA-related sulfurtransferase